MLSLRDLQIQFAKALNNQDSQVLSCIHETSRLTPEGHLHIYKSNIFGALQKVLKEIYPVCHKLVGEDFFLYLMNAYIEKNISVSHDLGNYGGIVADFIADFEPAKSLPYLPDVARLEWAWHKQFTARNSPGMDFHKLAECYTDCGEKIIFSLPLDSILLCSSFPIHRIWEVNQVDYKGDQTVILTPNTYYYLVWRKNLEMRIDILDPLEWQVLQWVNAAQAFGTICERLNENMPDTDIAILMPRLVECGWLAGFTV